jgi:hypothetical protein
MQTSKDDNVNGFAQAIRDAFHKRGVRVTLSRGRLKAHITPLRGHRGTIKDCARFTLWAMPNDYEYDLDVRVNRRVLDVNNPGSIDEIVSVIDAMLLPANPTKARKEVDK